ncbi:malate synthase A [Azospirillum griseum]|uniref:malate synthase n=1 Tax=Azospirillum griseum TaxID=2496639 RepID=A0A3S0ID73_9PROT|nr:malate synthase A [Azospirillum griseum]RTR17434.1 malate synthase A [Azospirillum griseum]
MADIIAGLEIRGSMEPGFDRILTPEALAFLAELEGRFGPERLRLLDVRAQRQALFDQGKRPDLLPETRAIREADWTIAPLPVDLRDRRVEITGPVDRKTVINALNSEAKLFMADFEDASSPTWANLLHGQINLYDAVRRTITHEDPATGKTYRLTDRPAVLAVRPRGWHRAEPRLRMEGEAVSAALFDAGLFLFHNARDLLARGSGPYLYLPKLESHFEARLWREVFVLAEECLGLPYGSIKATVLIETITAAFEMDEILYELRDHAAGLNCGRWGYIASVIKTFRNDPAAVLPDRAAVTMDTPFLSAYSQLAVKVGHRRNAPVIGGMSAFIPVKDDPAANEAAFSRVRADKEREASNGHDGTWVAHPGLVPVAMAVFDAYMPTPNQTARKRADVAVTAADLLALPTGPKTEAGLRTNIAVGIAHIAAWRRGVGCVPLFNQMEDAATADISRSQVWHWIRHAVTLDDGRTVTVDLVRALIAEELAARNRPGTPTAPDDHAAAALFTDLVTAPDFIDFLTTPADDRLLAGVG